MSAKCDENGENVDTFENEDVHNTTEAIPGIIPQEVINSSGWWHPDFESLAMQLPGSALRAMKERLESTMVRGENVHTLHDGIRGKHDAILTLFESEIKRYKRHLARKRARRREKLGTKTSADDDSCAKMKALEDDSCAKTKALEANDDECTQTDSSITMQVHEEALRVQKAALKAEFLRVAEEHLMDVKSMYERRINALTGNEALNGVVKKAKSASLYAKHVNLDDLIEYSERYIVDLLPKGCETVYNNRALNHYRQVLRWCLHYLKKSHDVSEMGTFEAFQNDMEQHRELSNGIYTPALSTGVVRDSYMDFVANSVPFLKLDAFCKLVITKLQAIPVHIYYDNVTEPHRLISRARLGVE